MKERNESRTRNLI